MTSSNPADVTKSMRGLIHLVLLQVRGVAVEASLMGLRAWAIANCVVRRSGLFARPLEGPL